MRTLFYLTFSFLILTVTVANADRIHFTFDDNADQIEHVEDNIYKLSLQKPEHDDCLIIKVKPSIEKHFSISFKDHQDHTLSFKAKSNLSKKYKRLKFKNSDQENELLVEFPEGAVHIVIGCSTTFKPDTFEVISLNSQTSNPHELLIFDSFKLRKKSRTAHRPRRARRQRTALDDAVDRAKAKVAQSAPVSPASPTTTSEDWKSSPHDSPLAIVGDFNLTTAENIQIREREMAPSPYKPPRISSPSSTSSRRTFTRSATTYDVSKDVRSRRRSIYGTTSPTTLAKQKRARRKKEDAAAERELLSREDIRAKTRAARRKLEFFQQQQLSASTASSTRVHNSPTTREKRRTRNAEAKATLEKRFTPRLKKKTSRKSSPKVEAKFVSSTMKTPPSTPMKTDSPNSPTKAAASPMRRKSGLKIPHAWKGWRMTGELPENQVKLTASDLNIDFSATSEHQGMSYRIDVDGDENLFTFSASVQAIGINSYIALYEKEGDTETPIKLICADESEKQMITVVSFYESPQNISFTANLDPSKSYRLIFFKDESPVEGALILTDFNFSTQ